MPPLTKARMILALHEAFKAGMEYGGERELCFSDRERPSKTEDEVFSELLQAERGKIHEALRLCK